MTHLHNRFFFSNKPLWILCLIYIGVISCTPKVTEELPKSTDPAPVVNPTTEEEIFKSPCATFDDLNGADKETAMTAYVLYRDNMKANRMEEALVLWRQAYGMAPASNGKVKSQYDDGVKLYKYLFEKETDAELKKKYVDSVFMLYDKRAYCFDEKVYVSGLKAFDAFYYFPSYIDTSVIFSWFTEHIDAKGLQSEYFVINPFSKMLYDRVVSGKISAAEGARYATLITQIVENGVANCSGKTCDTWKVIEGYAPVQMELLEGVEDFYDCTYYSHKYMPLVNKYPDSCELVNTAYTRLFRGGCDPKGADLAKLTDIRSKQCYVAPETPGLAKQGYDAYLKGRYKEAVQKFEQFIQESSDKEVKAKYYLLISKIYYGDLKNFSVSRQYARRAADLKPNWGEPYMLIGKLYASSGPLCGPGTGWDSQIVTWVAIDQFQMAKSVDPSFTSEANKWISRYSQYMPKKEDLFFRGIKEGAKYFVPCWIQEQTTARASD